MATSNLDLHLEPGARGPARPFLSGSHVGLQLPDLLTRACCESLAAALDARGFMPTGHAYPAGYRDNDRLVFDDAPLAGELWRIVEPLIPRELVFEGECWAATRLNERFRACRYRDGQSFTVHRDGAHVSRDGTRSWLTLQLYLTDGTTFAGGDTRFYSERRGAPHASVAPVAGHAVLFDHRAWHDGAPVTAGTKIVLRTDVMFRKDARGAQPEERGSVLWRHDGYAWRVLVRCDGTVVSSGRDGTIRGEQGVLAAPGEGSITALAEDAAGRLWWGTRSSLVGWCEPRESGGARRVAALGAAVLDMSAGGDGLVTCALASGEVAQVARDGSVRRVATHEGWCWSLARWGDGLLSAGEDGRLALDRSTIVRHLPEYQAVGEPARAVAVAGSRILVGTAAGNVMAFDPERAADPLPAHGGAITALAAQGDRWASAGEDGCVHLWMDRRRVMTWTCEDFVRSVALGAGGWLVFAGYDGRVRRVSTC